MSGISCTKILSVVIVVVLMTGTNSMAADVTYDYTGQPFTWTGGDVTTDQYITASATFTDPVFPSNAVAPSSFVISFAGEGLPSFSLDETATFVYQAEFNFDASGDITSWNLWAGEPVGSNPTIWYTLRTHAGPLNDPYPDADILHVFDPHTIHGGRSDVPGEWVPRAMPVDIDIKPGSYPNSINNNGNGVIPVAILGDVDFDVSLILPWTVELEGMAVKTVGKKNKILAHYEDVNGDGFDDLVVQIQDVEGTFAEGATEAMLTGELMDGTLIDGFDEIDIVFP